MRLIRIWAAALALAVAAWAPSASASDLTADLVRESQTDHEFRIAFWLAPEFFAAANPDASAADKAALTHMLDGYAVFMVADAKVSPLGTPTPIARDDLIRGTSLRIGDGTPLSALPDDQLKGDIKTLGSVFKPLMRNVLGQFGEMIEVVAFRLPADKKDAMVGKGEGSFRLTVNGDDFSWRLPLGSLLPPMFDSTTGEEFPGNFKFSPYSGQKLERH